MGLTIKTPPGFSDLADSVLASGQPALGLDIAKIYNNSVFGMERVEVFLAHYKNGDTVPLPVSPIDGYTYSRNELLYFWAVESTADLASAWMTGADSLFYCAWLVDQATGIVYSDEWYRRSGSHAAVTHTNDGVLRVFTIAQRQQTNLIMAASPSYSAITGSTVALDKPLTQLLAQSLNDDAKFTVVNKEVFYLGEYYNGQTVTLPISPVDGYHYSAGECKFMFSWRWTPAGNVTPMQGVSLGNGQLGPIQASVNSSGVVSTTIHYVDANGNLNAFNDGRIAVFAFCTRSGTPGSITPAATGFAEIDFNDFMPGAVQGVEFPTVQQIIANIQEAVLTPEYFGPTIYKDGDTIPLPTSPIDGYAYSRSELYYLYEWSDTTNQTGSNLRTPVWFSDINGSTGVVRLNVWRLPPGGPYVDDNNTLSRIRVLVVARRAAQAPAALGVGASNPPVGSTTTGGNVVADVPTLSSLSGVAAIGSINSSNQAFTLPASATIVFLVWDGQVRFDFAQTSPPSTSFTTTFTPDTGDTLYAVVVT